MKLKLTAPLALSFVCGTFAYAAPITISTSAYASGYIQNPGGSPAFNTFVNQLVTVSFTGDTNEIYYHPLDPRCFPGTICSGIEFYEPQGATKINIPGLGTFTDATRTPHFRLSSGVFPALYIDSNPKPFSTDDVQYFTLTPDDFLQHWNGLSSIAPITLPLPTSFGDLNAPLNLNPGYLPFKTNVGTFGFTATATTGTFQAVVGSASAVPEPNSFLLLSTGVIGLVGVLRKKFFRT